MNSVFWTDLAKDLRIEWRSLDAIVSMLFFAGLVVVLFSISFDPRGAISQQIAGGVLCVATMFASVSALNQAWAREYPIPGDGCAANDAELGRAALLCEGAGETSSS